MTSIPWPHIVDHDRKLVRVYVEGGWPIVMGVPHVVRLFYPDYDVALDHRDPTK